MELEAKSTRKDTLTYLPTPKFKKFLENRHKTKINDKIIDMIKDYLDKDTRTQKDK